MTEYIQPPWQCPACGGKELLTSPYGGCRCGWSGFQQYVAVRGMSDEQIVEAGLRSEDFLTRELANRYDVVCEKLASEGKSE